MVQQPSHRMRYHLIIIHHEYARPLLAAQALSTAIPVIGI